MYIECTETLPNRIKEEWINFLNHAGLTPDLNVEHTVFIWDNNTLVATGSRQRNVLKCIAVDDGHQGEGLTATLLTQLRQDAFSAGYRHLFLYTKPKNQALFSSLFFYPVVKTAQVLLMENVRNGISDFLSGLEAPLKSGTIGAAVMNCNPFTWGHRYLIENAAAQCDWLYVFVLSEDQSLIPAADRRFLVQQGTQDLKNVTVHPTGQYLISSATFPSYFLKDQNQANIVNCQLDIAVFTQSFVPHFGITRRFVGSEPFCPITKQYNDILRRFLPEKGVMLCELPRMEQNGIPISAGAVRKLLSQNQPERLKQLVPPSTFEYLKRHDLV